MLRVGNHSRILIMHGKNLNHPHPLMNHACSIQVSFVSSRDITRLPSAVSPILDHRFSGRISGDIVDSIGVHLLRCLLQWRFVLRGHALLLGRLSDGDSGSLETFPRRNDDEGDRGV